MKLTIGMASYNNYQEVWAAVQALRLYHDLTDTEILVVDNFGDDRLQSFIAQWGRGQVRYVRYTEKNGTAAPRDHIFKEAKGDWVLVIDSHVLLFPGTVKRFRDWTEAHADCRDLIHGPLVYDDLTSTVDSMTPKWEGDMWGVWNLKRVSDEQDPYEIRMHGLGLFACRKDSWLGFNPDFRGFGGEEGYIHQKFRNAGRKALCLPFLKWDHFFSTIAGKCFAPYSPKLNDILRNYEIGFDEVGIDKAPMREYFKNKGVEMPVAYPVSQIQIDLSGACGSQCWFCPVRYLPRPPRQVMPMSLYTKILDGILDAVKTGHVIPSWSLWLSSYNDVLVDPLIFGRLEELRRRKLRFTLLTNGIGLLKHADLLHEYKDVIGGWSVNLAAGNPESYEAHTKNPREVFHSIIAGLKALHAKDPAYYGQIVNVCVNSMWPQDYEKLKYPLPENDGETQVAQLKALLPGMKIHLMRSMCDRGGLLAPHAIDGGTNIRSVGCNNGGDRLKDWLHINTFGETYLCCTDYHEKSKYADLKKQSVSEVVAMKKDLEPIRRDLCDKCAFAK